MNFIARLAAILATALASAAPAWAQYPAHPIKWVVPYPPAGTTDVIARVMPQYMSDKLGQQVVIENKPGAGNNIGVEYVVPTARVNPPNGINTTLYKNLNFDFVRDIAGGRHRAHAERDGGDAVAEDREGIHRLLQEPGKINMASSGSGVGACPARCSR